MIILHRTTKRDLNMFKTLKNKKHTPELAINYIKNQFCSKL